ncbi:fungal cellulose binding domain-containing protein [Colletotrichum lupini]|uniref:Fungal cellulose binding domain-containing protein n=1 Tax=Colletotrichum lupini TaxID=145971 RepID=A0A9Q8WE52_9PEZI|nr:fungal cellulose binding domain-containing protein [Colletotrichum lupini]UQC79417.1 fungal cellulose binding domain-containing protein [Colletotrichum lupini]
MATPDSVNKLRGIILAHPSALLIWRSKSMSNNFSYHDSGVWFRAYEFGPVKFSPTSATDEWGTYDKDVNAFTNPSNLAAGGFLFLAADVGALYPLRGGTGVKQFIIVVMLIMRAAEVQQELSGSPIDHIRH